MIYGFTGTSKGMTQKQRATFRYLLNELQVTILHHGDCVGADAQAHVDAMARGCVIVHPPTDDKLRAYCDSPNRCVVRKPKGYLARNRDIVREGVDGLLATPKDFICPSNLRGQGTWTTIGYGRKFGRPIHIIFPDGTYKYETSNATRSVR